jgi:hypothetical protein
MNGNSNDQLMKNERLQQKSKTTNLLVFLIAENPHRKFITFNTF